jgi:hypothetical protein
MASTGVWNFTSNSAISPIARAPILPTAPAKALGLEHRVLAAAD